MFWFWLFDFVCVELCGGLVMEVFLVFVLLMVVKLMNLVVVGLWVMVDVEFECFDLSVF